MTSGLSVSSLSPYRNSSTSSATARIFKRLAFARLRVDIRTCMPWRPARARRPREFSGQDLFPVRETLDFFGAGRLEALGEAIPEDQRDLWRRVKPGNVDEVGARRVELERMRDVLG